MKFVEFAVELRGCISIQGSSDRSADAAIIEKHLDQVMEELMVLDAQDPSIELDLTNDNEVTFSLAVEVPNPVSAVEIASGLLRTAIHAAGGGTPDWPNIDDEAWSIQLLGISSSIVL